MATFLRTLSLFLQIKKKMQWSWKEYKINSNLYLLLSNVIIPFQFIGNIHALVYISCCEVKIMNKSSTSSTKSLNYIHCLCLAVWNRNPCYNWTRSAETKCSHFHQTSNNLIFRNGLLILICFLFFLSMFSCVPHLSNSLRHFIAEL